MYSKSYIVVGGDRRYDHLNQIFLENKITSLRINSDSELGVLSECRGYDAVLPYPISPDGINIRLGDGGFPIRKMFEMLSENGIKKLHAGGVKENVRSVASELGLEIKDYGLDEALLQKNALCSAEGAVAILMKELEKLLHGAKFAVIGYGRIGRIAACKLRALGADACGVARRAESRAQMETDGIKAYSFDCVKDAFSGASAVINTVPSKVLGEKELSCIEKDAFVLDLASSPGGVDNDAAKRLGVRVIWALSIPGKYCPESAAEIIFEHLKREEGWCL